MIYRKHDFFRYLKIYQDFLNATAKTEASAEPNEIIPMTGVRQQF